MRTWGNSPDGDDGAAHRHLPARRRGQPAAAARAARRCSSCAPATGTRRSSPLLADEIVKDEPGQEAVLDRLLDLLLIAVAARPGSPARTPSAPGWYRAYGDPVVGRALRLLHHNPAHPWTVAELAAATGVSRAALARRFNELVGEPPMAFLTGWRIALAADLLREPGATVGSVADAGRLRQPVRAQHRVQARARRQPAAAPRGLASCPLEGETSTTPVVRLRRSRRNSAASGPHPSFVAAVQARMTADHREPRASRAAGKRPGRVRSARFAPFSVGRAMNGRDKGLGPGGRRPLQREQVGAVLPRVRYTPPGQDSPTNLRRSAALTTLIAAVPSPRDGRPPRTARFAGGRR